MVKNGDMVKQIKPHAGIYLGSKSSLISIRKIKVEKLFYTNDPYVLKSRVHTRLATRRESNTLAVLYPRVEGKEF